jgi:transposase
MARYKSTSYDQQKLIPIDFASQIIPGTFEYTLNYLIDHELDLSVFDDRYHNDETGAPAFSPAILLKIILYAYSRGITASRKIEQVCRENIIFMALSADTQPHFTTIADFISSMDQEIVALFRNVLMICDDMRLIGRDMFAIDGCKLPSNAAKEWSGTKWELSQKKKKMEKAIRHMLKHHREEDQRNNTTDATRREKEQQTIQTMKQHVKKLKDWLDDNDDKPGKCGKPKKSNITDNESAKMKTSKGVIQGYDGVASVDSKHQVIIHAEAFGEAQEHDLLQPMVEGTEDNFAAIESTYIKKKTKLTADSGFYTKKNVEYLYTQNIDGYLPDIGFRKRDLRFHAVDKYKERHRQEKRKHRKTTHYTSPDFHYDAETHTCICPAGKKLYSNGRNLDLNGYEALRFRGAKRDCLPCNQRHLCMKDPSKTQTRQATIFIGRAKEAPQPYIDHMKHKIDTPQGRFHYSRRIGIVEPVFGNITSTLGLKRFSLRSKKKVDIQWKLYCMVHNLLKIHRFGEIPV